MANRIMSDAEIKRRKRVQGHVSQTTGALGLTSLGAFAAGRAGGSGKFAVKAQKVVPKLKKINQKKADTVAVGTSSAAGGIGGLGAFNFAAYTNAESRKRKPVAKAWEPSNDKYSPEGQRKRREKAYVISGAASTAGLAGGAVANAARGEAIERTGRKKHSAWKSAQKASRSRAGKLGLAAVGTGAVTAGVQQKRKSRSWDTYSKSAHNVSAFGVLHD